MVFGLGNKINSHLENVPFSKNKGIISWMNTVNSSPNKAMISSRRCFSRINHHLLVRKKAELDSAAPTEGGVFIMR